MDESNVTSPATQFNWNEQVYRDTEGNIYNPLASSSRFLFTYNCICCVIGLLASGRVIYKTVITCNEDGWRPRHVLLIGTIVSCIMTLLVHCLIPAVYFVWPNDDLCRLFILSFRLPYIAFLFNILLALIDRYVAVTRSIWHRTKFSRSHCIIWLSLLNLLLAMAVKWLYISGIVSVDCAIHIAHGLTILVTILVLFVLCTGFPIAVFVITWRQLPRAARAIPVPTPVAPPLHLQVSVIEELPINPVDIEYVLLKDLLPPTVAAVIQPPTEEEEIATDKSNESSMTTSQSSSSAALRELELKVTIHFLFTLLPLILLVIPVIIFGFCLLFYPSLVIYISYFSVLPSLHVLVYPLANLFLSNKEISFSFRFPGCLRCQDQTKNQNNQVLEEDLYS